jgi:hypothetical protein
MEGKWRKKGFSSRSVDFCFVADLAGDCRRRETWRRWALIPGENDRDPTPTLHDLPGRDLILEVEGGDGLTDDPWDGREGCMPWSHWPNEGMGFEVTDREKKQREKENFV